VTADDVKASIQRALRIPGIGRTLLGDLMEGGSAFVAGQAKTISGITTSGHSLIIRLTRPFAFLPDRLAVSLFSIVPAETPDDREAPPLGTGPYIIDRWDRTRNRVTLKKNPQYFNANPKAPDTIEVYVFTDTAAAVQELKAGTVQWIEAGASALDLLRGDIKGKVTARAVTGLDYKLVAFNLTKGRFADSDGTVLARALNYATDREKLILLFLGGKPVYGPIPVGSWADRGYRYDKAKALELVNGLFPEKRNFRLLVEPGAESRHLAEALGAQWKEIGIDVAMDQGQTDFFPRLANGDFEAALAYFGPMLPTAEQYLWPFRATSRPIPNVMGYVSPEFEAADQALTGSATVTDQQAAADRAVGIVLEDAPMVWIIHPPRCTATTAVGDVERISGLPKFWTWK
jgi:peptide/nickel transport system substrate-binding protein